MESVNSYSKQNSFESVILNDQDRQSLEGSFLKELKGVSLLQLLAIVVVLVHSSTVATPTTRVRCQGVVGA